MASTRGGFSENDVKARERPADKPARGDFVSDPGYRVAGIDADGVGGLCAAFSTFRKPPPRPVASAGRIPGQSEFVDQVLYDRRDELQVLFVGKASMDEVTVDRYVQPPQKLR